MTREWRNWGRTERSSPQSLVFPRSADEVMAEVNHARETGGTVRPIGAGHSFSGVAATDGVQMSLHNLRGITEVDLVRSRVTFWAGTYLWEVPGLLGPYGLALENMGDIDRQSIAGAISTGTHGTGVGFGSVSTQVVGVSFVTGTGELRTVTDQDGPMLQGLALSLGALGVLVTVTFQCVPAYLLHAVEAPESLSAVLNTLQERFLTNDHFEFYWFPHTDQVRTKTNRRFGITECEPLPQNRFKRFLDTEVANNLALGSLVAIQHHIPSLTPRVNRSISAISSRRTYRDYWHRVLVTRRRVRFREMEYAVPLDTVPEVLRELNEQIERRRLSVSFPVEVRAASADQLWLSPTNSRQCGYIAVHRYWRERDEEYFRIAEEIFRSVSGLPHWGKMHTLAHPEYARELPNFERFQSLRNAFDPDRVFGNSYLSRVLGE